jgi:cell division protein FtsA
MEGILFGLDIGTTKVCAVIGEVRGGQLRIIGFGLAPAQGMNKGMIVDVAEASVAVAKAVEQAEQTSGYDLSQALVSLGGRAHPVQQQQRGCRRAPPRRRGDDRRCGTCA